MCPSFDKTRIRDIAQYNNLSTPRDRTAFMFMVMDYMDYIRSDPRTRVDWDEEEEKETVVDFVKAVNSVDAGWPQAVQVVPEFQEPATDIGHLPQPFQYIMRAVRARLPTPRPCTVDSQMAEEALLRQKYESHCEYIGFLGGLRSSSSTAQIEAVQANIDAIANAIEGLRTSHVADFQEEESGILKEFLEVESTDDHKTEYRQPYEVAQVVEEAAGDGQYRRGQRERKNRAKGQGKGRKK